MIWIHIQFSPFSRLLKMIKNTKSKQFNSTFSFENTYTDVVTQVINNVNVAERLFNFIKDHFNYCIAYGDSLLS